MAAELDRDNAQLGGRGGALNGEWSGALKVKLEALQRDHVEALKRQVGVDEKSKALMQENLALRIETEAWRRENTVLKREFADALRENKNWCEENKILQHEYTQAFIQKTTEVFEQALALENECDGLRQERAALRQAYDDAAKMHADAERRNKTWQHENKLLHEEYREHLQQGVAILRENITLKEQIAASNAQYVRISASNKAYVQELMGRAEQGQEEGRGAAAVTTFSSIDLPGSQPSSCPRHNTGSKLSVEALVGHWGGATTDRHLPALLPPPSPPSLPPPSPTMSPPPLTPFEREQQQQQYGEEMGDSVTPGSIVFNSAPARSSPRPPPQELKPKHQQHQQQEEEDEEADDVTPGSIVFHSPPAPSPPPPPPQELKPRRREHLERQKQDTDIETSKSSIKIFSAPATPSPPPPPPPTLPPPPTPLRPQALNHDQEQRRQREQQQLDTGAPGSRVFFPAPARAPALDERDEEQAREILGAGGEEADLEASQYGYFVESFDPIEGCEEPAWLSKKNSVDTVLGGWVSQDGEAFGSGEEGAAREEDEEAAGDGAEVMRAVAGAIKEYAGQPEVRST